MPETPNHGYNVPNEGEQDWHVPLNENFEQYDTDIEIRDVEDARSNYEPKEGAKFFATDTENVFLGDGSDWVPQGSTGMQPAVTDLYSENVFTNHITSETGEFSTVEVRDWFRAPAVGVGRSPKRPVDVAGRNNWNLDDSDGDVRIGDNDYRLAMGVALEGGGKGACNVRAKGGIERLNLGAGTSGHTVQIDEDAVSVNGDLEVSGNKNFTQTVDTAEGPMEVVYTATEADTPRTETSGVVELTDGCAEVDLPEHFAWVTSDDEPLVVQVTAHAGEAVRPQVTERSTDRVVVEDFGEGPAAYEVSYTVRGTREGRADKQVVRDPADPPLAAGHAPTIDAGDADGVGD